MDTDTVRKIAVQIENLDTKELGVEDIQDLVVKKLMATSRKDVAMLYQGYRAVMADKRDKEKNIYKQINELIDATDKDQMNENANKDSKTISVQRDLLAGISSKDYYLNKILPKHLKHAHEAGEIHIHDLDYLLFRETNCELVDVARMLKGGCKIGNAKMLEPNSVDVAVGHIVQIIASVSSNTYGGCSIPYLDKVLVPYIIKSFKKHFRKGLKYVERLDDETVEKIIAEGNIEYSNNSLKDRFPSGFNYAADMTEESVKQAMQGLEYEINSLSTVNGQTPFTTYRNWNRNFLGGKISSKICFQNKNGRIWS